MICVVTGGSLGIGEAVVARILKLYPHVKVYNLDVLPPKDEVLNQNLDNYKYIECDVSKLRELPNIENVNFLVNNAGIQGGSIQRILDVNLLGVMNCTRRYALGNPDIKSVVNLASVSAHNGAEFLPYCASKGGVLSYTKATAKYIAPRATCNSLSFGGVETPLNAHVMNDSTKWNRIMEMTPMKKWASADEAAEWIVFLLFRNKSMTGQDIIIDNGEIINHEFVW